MQMIVYKRKANDSDSDSELSKTKTRIDGHISNFESDMSEDDDQTPDAPQYTDVEMRDQIGILRQNRTDSETKSQ